MRQTKFGVGSIAALALGGAGWLLACSACGPVGADGDRKPGGAALSQDSDQRARPQTSVRQWHGCAPAPNATALIETGPTLCSGPPPQLSTAGPGEPYLHLGLALGAFDPLCTRQLYRLSTITLIDGSGKPAWCLEIPSTWEPIVYRPVDVIWHHGDPRQRRVQDYAVSQGNARKTLALAHGGAEEVRVLITDYASGAVLRDQHIAGAAEQMSPADEMEISIAAGDEVCAGKRGQQVVLLQQCGPHWVVFNGSTLAVFSIETGTLQAAAEYRAAQHEIGPRRASLGRVGEHRIRIGAGPVTVEVHTRVYMR